jgi:hypothetical protein
MPAAAANSSLWRRNLPALQTGFSPLSVANTAHGQVPLGGRLAKGYGVDLPLIITLHEGDPVSVVRLLQRHLRRHILGVLDRTHDIGHTVSRVVDYRAPVPQLEGDLPPLLTSHPIPTGPALLSRKGSANRGTAPIREKPRLKPQCDSQWVAPKFPAPPARI